MVQGTKIFEVYFINCLSLREEVCQIYITVGDSMYELELVEASKKYEKQAMAYRQEFIDYGEKLINGSNGLIEYEDYDDWLTKLAIQKETECTLTNTPATTYFTIRQRDNKIIGSIQLRHHLTEELRKDGGHIGYGICPSERGKGYGIKQLSLLLVKAKELNISQVVIHCTKDNRASAKVVIQNGGLLIGEGFDEEEGKVSEIYYIDIIMG